MLKIYAGSGKTAPGCPFFASGGGATFTGVVRAGIHYLIIIVEVRLMGKCQVGELEPSDVVLSLIIADLASVSM